MTFHVDVSQHFLQLSAIRVSGTIIVTNNMFKPGGLMVTDKNL